MKVLDEQMPGADGDVRRARQDAADVRTGLEELAETSGWLCEHLTQAIAGSQERVVKRDGEAVVRSHIVRLRSAIEHATTTIACLTAAMKLDGAGVMRPDGSSPVFHPVPKADEDRAEQWRQELLCIGEETAKALPHVTDVLEAVRVLVDHYNGEDEDEPRKGVGVSFRPGVMGGEACILGTRIPPAAVASFAEVGMSEEKIQEQYPSLSIEQIRYAIEWWRTTARGLLPDGVRIWCEACSGTGKAALPPPETRRCESCYGAGYVVSGEGRVLCGKDAEAALAIVRAACQVRAAGGGFDSNVHEVHDKHLYPALDAATVRLLRLAYEHDEDYGTTGAPETGDEPVAPEPDPVRTREAKGSAQSNPDPGGAAQPSPQRVAYWCAVMLDASCEGGKEALPCDKLHALARRMRDEGTDPPDWVPFLKDTEHLVARADTEAPESDVVLSEHLVHFGHLQDAVFRLSDPLTGAKFYGLRKSDGGEGCPPPGWHAVFGEPPVSSTMPGWLPDGETSERWDYDEERNRWRGRVQRWRESRPGSPRALWTCGEHEENQHDEQQRPGK